MALAGDAPRVRDPRVWMLAHQPRVGHHGCALRLGHAHVRHLLPRWRSITETRKLSYITHTQIACSYWKNTAKLYCIEAICRSVLQLEVSHERHKKPHMRKKTSLKLTILTHSMEFFLSLLSASLYCIHGICFLSCAVMIYVKKLYAFLHLKLSHVWQLENLSKGHTQVGYAMFNIKPSHFGDIYRIICFIFYDHVIYGLGCRNHLKLQVI